jgi:hypothetical protein
MTLCVTWSGIDGWTWEIRDGSRIVDGGSSYSRIQCVEAGRRAARAAGWTVELV